MDIRSKTAFLSGTITDNPLTDVATTINSAALASLPAIVAPKIAVLILDPTGSAGAPEVVHVTAHTGSATSATVTRGAEGSTNRQHASGIAWVQGPTIIDIEEDFATTIRRHILASSYKGAVGLSGPAVKGSYANADLLGVGWQITLTGTSTILSALSTGNMGHYSFQAGGSGEYCSIKGGFVKVAANPGLIFRGIISDEVNRSLYIGFANATDPTDANNRIGFRILTGGNVIGFVDNGGTETVRDSGAVPTGAEQTLEILVSGDGTIVRFFVDNVQVGADVTTNIYTGAVNPLVGIVSAGGGNDFFYMYNAAYWWD